MSWQQTTLGEVAEIVSGSTPKSGIPRYWDGVVAWATPTDLSRLDGKHLDKTDRTITEAGLNECSARLLPPGSVLFSSRAPIGLVAINTKPMATNQGFKSFVPRPELNADYLYWWLRANRRKLEDLGNGATFKEVSKAVVSRVQFPLPPLTEQRRIAGILDKADAIRHKREQALALADDFLRSLFLEMFGDPNSQDHSFPVTTLEAICEIITDCLHTTPNHFDEPNPYPSIRSSELQGGYIDLSSAKYVSEAEYKVRIQRYRPVPGDTIYCREGARFGSCGIIPEGMSPCLGQRTMLLRADRKVATPEYLWGVLRSNSTFQQALNVVGGAASPHVNIKDIRKFRCFLPPLSVQRQFSLICQRGFSQRNRLVKQGVQSENLFAALSQRAFAGDL